jgi:hypothetical protein
MAKKLKEFDFNRTSRSAYPWDQWLDGNVWALEAGADFEGKMGKLQSAAYVAAKARGGKVRTQRIDETTLAIQFYTDAE